MPPKKLQKAQNIETDSSPNGQDQEEDELIHSSSIKIVSEDNENISEIKIKEEPMEVVPTETFDDDEEISIISPMQTKKRLFVLEDDEENSEGKN
jgi:hypothetical protein